MSISVEKATGSELDRWNSWLDRSEHASPFHRRAVLKLIAEHYDMRHHPLVGYKGEEPIGIFPLFETKRGPFTVVSSPPSVAEIAYMGPISVGLSGAKRRKIETARRRFVDGALEWVETELDPDIVQIRCTRGYTDVRPFLWNDFEAAPTYTYVVRLNSEPDELLASFSSDARQNIRQFEESDGTVEVGGRGDLETINELVRSRFAEKGLEHNLSTAFLTGLYEALGPDRVRPYVCTVNDEVVGGMLALKDGGTIYRWVGSVASGIDLPVNEAVDWRIIQDGIDEGFGHYDLHGAMERGISDYKSKFAPELRPLYELERKSSGAKAASGLIQQMPNSVSSFIN